LGFGGGKTIGECYVEDTGVGILWEVGRLIWIGHSDRIVKTVKQKSDAILFYGNVAPCHVFTVEIASEDYCVVLREYSI